ncbi:MAG: ABC transporter ATP-binding protein [Flavobacteriales bacterium CG03_land_8_20_14_0_80_35_15]|nr:MAG: ABC transporter ATP-binding protein [Flavobacteriales bacterium CG03_land_8_20_14_0_80_35_15]PIX06649.1 MAG: ABC transporter ATP-binding protein [Flavobacteriales bacterium CG_4_8_14_3_um_filter_35_10]PJA05200.1 MAG: ABC transporter ATP-binding protein [Flavobacteriales bacterium CG_4_10_14_0_2_um_filter_35_18]
MFDLDRWTEIFQTLSKNKLRTALSGFTIAFAILLFTLLFGIGNGLKHTFEKQFAGDAQNSVYIRSGKTTKPYKGLQSGRKVQFKNEDTKFINEQFEKNIQFFSPNIERFNVRAIYKGEQNNYTVRGVYPDYQPLESAVMIEGRFISVLDLKKRAKVVAIGKLVEEDLFKNFPALGRNISLDGISYRVIGVFSDPGGDNDERYIYMPFSTAQGMYRSNDELDQFGLTFNPALNVDKALAFTNLLEKVLKEKHQVDPRDQSALRVQNYAEGTKNVQQFMTVLNIIILFIGIGTLIAGIIGISNIMVYIVKERTKELGIRKALGATPQSIIGMIMMESIFVTALAGYAGLMIGVFTLKAIGSSLEKYFIVNPSVETYVVVGATIILIIAGTIAGYIPAKRASSIKPIEALNDQ